MTNKKKTNIDVLEAIVEMTLGEYGPLLIHEFRQIVLPKLKVKHKELSDLEFDEAMEHVKRDVPYYRAWLMNPRNRLPELPPGFFSSSLN